MGPQTDVATRTKLAPEELRWICDPESLDFETTRRTIMSDSMNKLGVSRRLESDWRQSARPVETVRQLLMG